MFKNYASQPSKSRGRLYQQEECKYRTPFQRDRDRIIHSKAFRRLQYKTQVFVNYEGDYYRTRLTHSIEVAQIARSISRQLGITEDLAETLALAHDLGHTPFGHAGEEALNEVMRNYGGFDHNAHTIKLLTTLEHRYPNFRGLNLCWESLEGIAKHNGPLIGPYSTNLPIAYEIEQYNRIFDLHLNEFPSLEAQIASLSDDIAYNNHDLEDGIRADFFHLEELSEIAIFGDIVKENLKQLNQCDITLIIYKTIREIMNLMIMDLIENTNKNILNNNIETIEDVRNSNKMIADFSPEINNANKSLKLFLMEKFYRHYKVNRMNFKTHKIIKGLFEAFFNDPKCLPTNWREEVKDKEKFERARIVADFIAGMTDRYAFKEYESIYMQNYE